MPAPERPAVFLDRDGVLNVDSGYPHLAEHLVWIEGARAAVRRINQAGYWAVVVTNQSGVGRGYFDEAAMDAFHGVMQRQLAQAGARIDAFYACPYHEAASVPRYRVADHPDRKPNPGMILRAFEDLPILRQGSFLVGDRDSDLAAARGAGLPGHLFAGGDLDAFVAPLLAPLT